MTDQPAPAYLDPLHDELDRLRTENAALTVKRDQLLTAWTDDQGHRDAILEQAEARVDQLTDQLALANDTLRRRGDAVNATGTSNDALRAKVDRVRALPNHWRALLDRGLVFGIDACIDDIFATLDQEPARD